MMARSHRRHGQDKTVFSRIMSNSKHILQQFYTIVQPPTLSDQEIIAKL